MTGRFNTGMKIVPVLDLQQGRVVRGIGGRRHQYLPLTPDCQPLTVAAGFRDRFGLTELYLADLDAIAGAPPSLPLYIELRRQGFTLWVDAGVRATEVADALFTAGIDSVVVGLETVTGPTVLGELCNDHAERIVFSLDLRDGVPLGNLVPWKHADARSIAKQAIELGVQRLLLLDLARVGMNGGMGTELLIGELIAAYPQIEFSAGGGVRRAEDLRRLKAMGVSAVLVASALHDGRIRKDDLVGL
jgi:phosphoribosylformimino-5-aminoimidazole carboxamide ribotide isomerase